MFYAYIIKGEEGITDSWEKCQKKVAGISNAKFKKFKTEKEAKEQAEDIVSIIHSFSEKLYGMRRKIKDEVDKIGDLK